MRTISIVLIFICLIVLTVSSKTLLDKSVNFNSNIELLLSNQVLSDQIPREELMETPQELTETKENTDYSVEDVVEVKTDENITEEEQIVYDGMTLDDLSAKLDRSLNSSLLGYGRLFATHSLELGLDPYLAVAIVLHETGCAWDCSDLVKQCNNVGGMKGSPGCFGGSYATFSTLEDGIIRYMDNLYNNYYAIGLTTPEAINPRYAESQVWASKINWYIDKIKQA